MKQTLRIIRVLTALIVVLLAVLLNWQDKNSAQTQEAPPQQSLTFMMAQKQHQHEAMLTDGSHLYRICSSRPQRTVSTQGSKNERTISLYSSCLARRYTTNPLNILYDDRRRLETAPFCLSASRDYYVIALRRIIR